MRTKWITVSSTLLFIAPILFLASPTIAKTQQAESKLKQVNNTPLAKDTNPIISSKLSLKRITQSDLTAGEKLNSTISQYQPTVALTLDLCMGQTDRRIFDTLLQHKIPATLFVTRRWLNNNANQQTLNQIRSHPELFEIADHGAQHLLPIDKNINLWGLKKADTAETICREAEAGLKAIKQAGLTEQMSKYYWYRGAGALYSQNAIKVLNQAGFNIAGFSINGDTGASVSAQKAFQQIIAAKDGDVIIAHMNQPKRPAGEGVAEAIVELQKRNYNFITLSQQNNSGLSLELKYLTWPQHKLITDTEVKKVSVNPSCKLD